MPPKKASPKKAAPQKVAAKKTTAKTAASKADNTAAPKDPIKRDFMVITASSVAGIGGAIAAWPFVNSMSPAADVLALSTAEVDVSSVEPGQTIKAKWRGKPVFIRRRTEAELLVEREVIVSELLDPQTDGERVQPGKEEWLVVLGSCTHLGCIPIADKGEYNGWFCPCHGSHYDVSGRIRKGPAPKNLEVPPFAFINDNVIRIG